MAPSMRPETGNCKKFPAPETSKTPLNALELRLDCPFLKTYCVGRTVKNCWFASAPKSERSNLPTFLFPKWGRPFRESMNADFLAVLEYWEKEKGISRDVLTSAVHEALLSAAKKAV